MLTVFEPEIDNARSYSYCKRAALDHNCNSLDSCFSLPDDYIKSMPPSQQQRQHQQQQQQQRQHFGVGDLVWGPRGIFSSWPGKVIWKDDRKARIFFFGNKETSEVEHSKLKSLMEGLEDQHREREKSRK